MKFLRRSSNPARHPLVQTEQPRSAAGAAPVLRTDEISRHAARLVVIPRDSVGETDVRRAREGGLPPSLLGEVVPQRAVEAAPPRAGDPALPRGGDAAPAVANVPRFTALPRAGDASPTGTNVRVTRFSELPSLLGEGDLVVVNDAATLPASLRGTTAAGAPFELRLSAPVDGTRLTGVAFGPGDHLTRTEDRLAPPPLGDRVRIAGLPAAVLAQTGRRVELAVHATTDALWQALYAHGRPIQYAHRRELLPLYAVQTAYASRPWSVEMPSAGRPLTWDTLLALRRRGVELAFLTHAAGLSSTGDDDLDRALPWPERYEIPRRTIDALARARRVIAVGTTVVRAIESYATSGDASSIARLKLDPAYRPRIVDGLISGLHAPGESHFELLSAFAPRERLVRAIELAAAHGLSAHELGDGCLVL